FFFFFFQAEDGIRDKLVTGVQTCALPISSDGNNPGGCVRFSRLVSRRRWNLSQPPGLFPSEVERRSEWQRTTKQGQRRKFLPSRSEERRVGKECRYRGERKN